MALAALGWNIDWFQFSLGAFLITLLFSLAGVWLISYTDEVLNYVLLSVPVLLLLSLPLLPYFELVEAPWLVIVPTQGPTNLLLETYDARVSVHTGLSYGMSIFWIVVFYVGAYWRFYKTVVD
jgi:fluoroquinolone transport system permease protein